MFPRLPPAAALDLGPLLPVAVGGESGPRAWLAFGFPAVALALWLAFLVARSRARSVARFRSTYDLVVALVIAFVLLFHLTVVALAAGGPPAIARAFLLLLGLGLAAMGNVMPRTRPNPIMGIRTRATLNDPVLWARMHRLFGGLLLTSGVLVMLLAVVAVQYALMGFIAALALTLLIVFGVHLSLSPGAGKASA
jgi:uncharacterized membrane protein